jgi:hypothetical protein
MLSESFNFAGAPPDGPHVCDEIPSVILAELNADMDRDMLARMRDLARKKRLRRPEITDEEMADYLALAENFQNLKQWMSARRSTVQSPVRATRGWVTAATIILGLLTTMLIAAIAITV